MAPTVRLHPDPPGISVARYIIAKTLSGGSPELAADLARRECRSTPQVQYAFDLELHHKTGVAAGSSTAAGYLSEMVPSGIPQEFFGLLMSTDGLGEVFTGMYQVPWNTAMPREAGAGPTGAWRGEALPALARSTLTDKFTLAYHEFSIYMVLSKEAVRFGRLTERFLTRTLTRLGKTFLFTQLLDPSIASTVNSPASLTHAAPTVSSTGSTFAQITADWANLIAAIGTPMNKVVAIMRPQTYYVIVARAAGAGCPQVPGQLFGIPVILSSASPQQIAIIDREGFAYATDAEVLVEASGETSVEMTDSSTQNANTGVGASLVSMLQTRSVAIKATMAANWAPIAMQAGSPTQVSGAAVMSVAY